MLNNKYDTFEISCRYYNGINPLPLEGVLFFELMRVRIVFPNTPSDFEEFPLEGFGYDAIKNWRMNGEEVTFGLQEERPDCLMPVFKISRGQETEDIAERISSGRGHMSSLLHFDQKWYVKAFLLMVAIVVSAYFFLNSLDVVHPLVSLKVDSHVGDWVDERLEKEYQVLPSNGINRFLENYTKRLWPEGSPRVNEVKINIIDHQMVNAFALPNGSIYFSRGLLEQAQSPEEVLGVLAHEIAHVRLRHSIRQLIKSVGTILLVRTLIGGTIEEAELAEGLLEVSGGLLVLKYSRELENEADRMAIDQLKDAAIDLGGLADFFRRQYEESEHEKVLEKALWLSTHPSSLERSELFLLEAKSQNKVKKVNLEAEAANWIDFLAANGLKSNQELEADANVKEP
ncbi:MAG: M48 family metallopeptidase [Planctomycetes bacterium]|nr:M48 family metallopeptidase [Planctomycetota bacterium]